MDASLALAARSTKHTYTVLKNIFVFTAVTLLAATAFAKQGVVRNLYTVPNTTFIEQPSGESVVTINDTTGSIVSVQTAIDTARSANPSNVIVIHLLKGAVYSVSSAGLVLGSHECLVAEGVIIQAADPSVTIPLITIASGSTNVSVAGGTLDGQGANTQGIFAPAARRVNIDKVVVKNFGMDGIFLNGNGNSVFDNEMTVTRSDVSGSNAAGIHIQNSTQTTVLDNNCHNNAIGIQISAAWANVANNTCHHNTTGIDIAGGNDNVVANNTCNNNGTGIHAGATKGMIVSNSLGNNSTAAIASDGTSNNFIDNLFTAGNTTNFISGGTTNNIVAYQAPMSASGQNYFYPPLIDNQHTDTTIVNGMGRTDLTISSTTIDDVQNQYNAALSGNPNNVIVLHLNGTFTVGANPLSLSSNTSVLLNGTIQINSSTTASVAITTSASGRTRISISGGIVDGGGGTGKNGISIASASMVQIDNMTLQNFGPANPRVGGSDVIHLSGGSTPYVVTRNLINGGAARGIWLQLSGQKSLISDNEVTNVNQDGVDCDSSTFGAVVKFNYCHDLVRYGVFIEQSAKNNLALGNVCNNDGRDINLFNNSTTPRGPTQLNSIISNSLLGNNGLRNGGGSLSSVVTSDNFFFNNTVINASIESQQNGSNNYYSQNYLLGGTLSTAGAEAFFNSADVSGNLQLLDSNSGLALIVQNASTSDGGAVVTAQPVSLGNGSNDDEWQFIPTTNGYYRIVNANSGLTMVIQGASLSNGAPVIQSPYTADSTFNDEWLIQPADNGLYNFVNRMSGLYLDVPGSSTTAGTQLDQSSSSGGANQQFNLLEDVPTPDFALSATPTSQTVVAGSSVSFTTTVAAANGFNGTVIFSVDGLPSGTNSFFDPTSVTGSGSSTLSISTSSSTSPGTYTLTITGISGNLSHSAIVTLIVAPPPDFSISAIPDSQAVVVGDSTSYIATISPLNGYTGTVSFSANGLPSGVTASFSPSSVSGGSGTSTLTISTTESSPTGSFPFTITGTDGTLTHSATITLNVFTSLISSLTPSMGPVATSVTITGTNFGSAQETSTVSFGGVIVPATSWSATAVTVLVPQLPVGPANVFISIAGSSSNTATFTVIPVITALSAYSGAVGSSITVTGSGFGTAQGASTLTFNGVTTIPTAWGDTSITVPVPDGATTGLVVVTVNGISTNGVPFTVPTPPPTIISVSPNIGAVGTSVTITGANFGDNQGSSNAYFTGPNHVLTRATVTSWSATSITAIVPVGVMTGNARVVVNGQLSNGVPFTVQ